MCDFVEIGGVVARGMQKYGNDVSDCFPVQTEIIPPRTVRPGKCPFSGLDLSDEERCPPGALTPRHTKKHVYEAFINPDDDTRCGMCGDGLDADTIKQFRANRREVAFRFCQKCRDYFALMAAVVNGDSMAIKVMQVYPPVRPFDNGEERQIAYEPQQTVNDIINMVPVRHPLPVKR